MDQAHRAERGTPCRGGDPAVFSVVVHACFSPPLCLALCASQLWQSPGLSSMYARSVLSIFDIFLVWKPFLAIPCCAVAPLIAHGDEVGFVYFGAEVLAVTSAALKENRFPRAWCMRQSDMLISWYHPCKS